MISTTQHIKKRGSIRGYTLTEILVSTGISSFILVAILQTFLMMGRSSYNSANYCIMESESRRAMETFSQEIRMAGDITWNSSTSITLTVPGSSTYTVTYAYDSGTSGRTAQSFYRVLGGPSSTATRRILVRNVTSLAFQRYKLVTTAVSNIASNDLETKQIQLTLQTTMKGQTTAAITNAVLSARYILRNKSVSA